MADLTAHGFDSEDDEGPETGRRVVWVNAENLDEYEDLILDELRNQPESYAAFCEAEDWLDRIDDGSVSAWVYFGEDNSCKGIVLFRMSQYANNSISLTLEFVSCRNFFAIARSIRQIEKNLVKMGITYVEAIAHPTIAQYFAYKHGYSAPGVYIRKAIGRERNN